MDHRERFLARVATSLGTAAALLLSACGGSDSPGGDMDPGGNQAGANGTLSISLTDQPACGFDHVFVTVERVRVHASASAGGSSGGWTDIAVDPVRKIDLLQLTNGRFQELGIAPLPAGKYTQVRLLLSPNPGGGTFGNSVVPTNGSEIALATPSAVQSGLKVIHPFTVEAGERVDLVIDFDACRSIVRRGNGTFGLKPVLTAAVMEVTEIVGFVTPSANVTVTAQKNGTVVRGTQPEADGSFRLAWLSAANAPYDVVFTAPGHATSVVRNVPVTQGTTILSDSAAPIALTASLSDRTASSTVNPVEAHDDGVVRAVQVVGAVPKVEVATTNVDDTSGNYSLTVPVDAPQLADFSTTLPLLFAPQGNAGLYTLEASATGFATATAAIDLNPGDVVQDFTLTP